MSLNLTPSILKSSTPIVKLDAVDSNNGKTTVQYEVTNDSHSPRRQSIQEHKEISASKSTFSQVVLRGKRDTESTPPTVISIKQGSDEHEYFLKHGNLWGFLPPENPPTSHPGVPEVIDPDDVHSVLQKYNFDHKYDAGDYALQQTVVNTMLEQEVLDPEVLIDVPENSTISGRLELLRNILQSPALLKGFGWADIQPGSISYNPHTKMLTYTEESGQVVSGSIHNFISNRRGIRDVLTLLLEVGEKFAAAGVKGDLQEWPKGKAPMNIIQMFYGVEPPQDLNASHEAANKLKENASFTEQHINSPEQDWELSRQQRRLDGIKNGMETSPQYVIEGEPSAE